MKVFWYRNNFIAKFWWVFKDLLCDSWSTDHGFAYKVMNGDFVLQVLLPFLDLVACDFTCCLLGCWRQHLGSGQLKLWMEIEGYEHTGKGVYSLTVDSTKHVLEMQASVAPQIWCSLRRNQPLAVTGRRPELLSVSAYEPEAIISMTMVSTESIVCLYAAPLKSQLHSTVLECLWSEQIEVVLGPTPQTDTPFSVHSASASTSTAPCTAPCFWILALRWPIELVGQWAVVCPEQLFWEWPSLDLKTSGADHLTVLSLSSWWTVRLAAATGSIVTPGGTSTWGRSSAHWR